jgi:antitoxin component YwqK of YwqJK toxin-antitoxin module
MYIDDMKIGEYKEYNIDGELIKIYNYVNGIKVE